MLFVICILELYESSKRSKFFFVLYLFRLQSKVTEGKCYFFLKRDSLDGLKWDRCQKETSGGA